MALRLAVLLTTLAAVAGCATVVPGRAVVGLVPADDLALIRLYLARYNTAGEQGVRAQVEFLRATQEPSTPMPPPRCFGSVTLQTRMVERTLRPAPGRTPDEAGPAARAPEGALYVAAVAVTALAAGTPVREETGTKQFIVRDGRVFAYAPCPR